MSSSLGEGFRFLQAAELRLDEPLWASSATPEWRTRLALARRRAAQGLWEVAIRERVDFVLLPGGVVPDDPAGSAAAWWLSLAWEQLAAAGIPVILDEARPDAVQWMHSLGLCPGNVTVLQDGRPTVVCRGQVPLARITRGARPVARDTLFTMGVLLTPQSVPAESEAAVDYWAVGGAVAASRGKQHASGSPQGASAADGGPHGGLLVTVQPDRSVSVACCSVDSVRWISLALEMGDDAAPELVRGQVLDSLHRLAAGLTSEFGVVSVNLTGGGELWRSWRRSEFRERLLQDIRQDQSGLSRLWVDEVRWSPRGSEQGEWIAAHPVLSATRRALERSRPHDGAAVPLAEWSDETPGRRQQELSLTNWQEFDVHVRPDALQRAEELLHDVAPPAAA